MATGTPKFASSLKRNQTAIVLLVAQLSIAGGALIVNILSARALGPSARGELALFLQIAYAANLLCLLGRQTALLRFPPNDKSLSRSLREAGILSRTPVAIAFLFSAVLGLCFEQWALSALIFSATFFAKLVSGVITNMHRAAAIASGTARPFLVATLLSQALLIAGSFAFVLIPIDQPAPWLLLYGLTASFPYLITAVVMSRRYPTLARSREELKAVSTLGIRLLPGGLAQAILVKSDRFLLPVLSTFAQLGMYSVVITMTELITWPVKQFAESKIPVWRVAYDENRLRWGRSLIKTLALSFAIALPLGIAIYFLLVPVFGDEYEASKALVLPLTLGAFLNSVIVFGVSVAVAVGRAMTVTIISIVNMVATVPALFLLIPFYGALGAAWATTAGYAVGVVVTIAALIRIGRMSSITRVAVVEIGSNEVDDAAGP